MSSQPFKQQPGSNGPDDGEVPEAAAAAPAAQTTDIDSMLDEIDGVLESNASEFVSGFVQKGGE